MKVRSVQTAHTQNLAASPRGSLRAAWLGSSGDVRRGRHSLEHPGANLWLIAQANETGHPSQPGLRD